MASSRDPARADWTNQQAAQNSKVDGGQAGGGMNSRPRRAAGAVIDGSQEKSWISEVNKTEKADSMNFLNKLDQVYQEDCTSCAILESQTDYHCFVPVEITDGAHAERFIVWKGAKSKLMLPCGKQRVYLTDEQIVETICAMDAEDTLWYLSQFIRLYKSEGQQLHLMIGDEKFELKGIGPYSGEKGLYLPSDTTISHRQFCYLLSFIFEKDARWEEIQPEYLGKKTLVKCILLVDWLCNNGPYSKEVLQELGYPLEDSSSNDRKKRKAFEQKESIEIIKTTFDISKYL